MSKITHISDYKKRQGYLERPYGQCGCGGDSFNLILTDWTDDADVFALQCCECREVVELEPNNCMIITCELE